MITIKSEAKKLILKIGTATKLTMGNGNLAAEFTGVKAFKYKS